MVLRGVQMKIVTGLGQKTDEAAKLLPGLRIDGESVGVGRQVAIPGAPNQHLSETGETKHIVLREFLHFLGRRAQLFQFVARLVGRDIIVYAQGKLAPARHLAEQPAMGKRDPVGLKISDRGETKPVELTKTTAQTLMCLVQSRRRNLAVDQFPRRFPL